MAEVSFLIDTGADGTLLTPTDAIRLGADCQRLESAGRAMGIGGPVTVYRAQGVLGLIDGTQLHLFALDLSILPQSPEYQDEGVTSLLGRDVLGRVALHCDPCHNIVQIDIHSSDDVMDLTEFLSGQDNPPR
jgi:hypothetical protein